jgi:hypothetical protein
MFSGVKFKALEDTIHGVPAYNAGSMFYPIRVPAKVGLVDKIAELEAQAEKLKAIVNELVDYVYAQKESK